MKDPGPITDPTSLRPILTELNGVDIRDAVKMDSFTKQDTMGQPVTASISLVNPSTVPQPGDTLRVLFHQSVEFAGMVDRVTQRTDDLAATFYDCELVDWSQILMRRQVRRNFTNMTVQTIVDSVLDNELFGERITMGAIDSRVTVPLVDASGHARVFDLFRDLASATGQTFFIDSSAQIQMRGSPIAGDRGTGVPSSSGPDFILDEAGFPILSEDGSGFLLSEQEHNDELQLLATSNVFIQGTSVSYDRETYRNVQTVVVTGTPQVENEDALIVTVQRTNDDQIAERQAVEGGTGRYEEIEEITHPISNRLDDLILMGNGYADLRLAISGTFRTTVTLQVRGYGFRAGQVGTIDLPTIGLTGDFILQRVSMTERAAQHLFHTLELTASSAQRRAYESWLAILGKGKIAIQLFSTVAHDSVTFTTVGSANWTVPTGVTVVTITARGGSASGGGAYLGSHFLAAWNGGKGGNSGKAVSSVSVVEGQELNIFIGAKGAPGGDGALFPNLPTNGADGGPTFVSRDGIELVRANGGGHGLTETKGGYGTAGSGTPGGGSGGIVTVGGGKVGGAGGIYNTSGPSASDGVVGKDGDVVIAW